MGLAMVKNKLSRWETLYEVVKNAKVGTVFNWTELQSITGIDCRRCRDIIYETNKELLKNKKNILINVRLKGYEISGNDGQIAHATEHKKKAGNQLKLCKVELSGIDPKTLSSEKKKDLILFMNHVSTSLNVIEGKAVKGIEQTKIAVQDQEENLAAIRKMKADLAQLALLSGR